MQMRGTARNLIAATAACLTLAAPARADTVTIIADQDATIFDDNTHFANGTGQLIHAGYTAGNKIRRALIRFPMASIPANSTINSVTMTLVVNHANGGSGSVNNTVNIYRITQDWPEGNQNGDTNGSGGGGVGVEAVAGSVTWSHRIYNTNAWTTPGGTSVATSSNTTIVPETVGPKTFSSAGLVADVQGWVNGTNPNYGWLIRGSETVQASARNFKSRQNTTVADRPKIVVDYTPPPTTGRCCLPDGSCIVTTPASCTSQGGTAAALGTNCTGFTCPQPQGGCCFSNGSCSILSPANCAAQGGTYRGNNTTCTPACPVLTGACCLPNATCSILSAAACASANGTYNGDNTSCATASCNWVLTPYVSPLPIPGVAAPISGTAGGAATYNIAITEFQHQFHPSLPQTIVWGYGGSYPGPTIEARRNLPVNVTWTNDLRVFGSGTLRTTHRLPVSTCLHGPDQNGVVPRTVTHLHGGHLRPDSDGDPDTAVPPGSASPVYNYPNNQQAGTLWYHDHALGLTRLNVYMGLAGLYVLRDSVEDALGLPSGVHEIPLVLQDRSFNADGSLKFNQTFSDQFFGDFNVVNGKVMPYLDVKRGKYRFRVVNGSNTRTYTLNLGGAGSASAPAAWLIGTDLGLRPAPLQVTSLTLMPGERADLVLDFFTMPAGSNYVLTNAAPVPFPGGGSGPTLPNIMQFRVGSTVGHTAALPATLATVTPIPTSEAVTTRNFRLQKFFDSHCGHDIWQINSLFWDDIVDFPILGTTEIWSWINRSGVAHPMHIHLVQFQVLDRQAFTVDGGGNIIPTGPVLPPLATELGWKDTVQATPNEITRVIARFENYGGTFPFHCHILDHEDHEMMRQFTVLCPSITISQQPVSTVKRAGQTATFTFSATATGATRRWYKLPSTTPLADGPTISGATTSTLTIQNVQAASAGTYYSTVTDACGIIATSSQATLSIACPADLDNGQGGGIPDGGTDISDLLYFLSCFENGAPCADLDNDGQDPQLPDGGVDISDLLYFLAHFEIGC
jgi:FtsP/CotA-like multicopper oxidase with cupredoxin domain